MRIDGVGDHLAGNGDTPLKDQLARLRAARQAEFGERAFQRDRVSLPAPGRGPP